MNYREKLNKAKGSFSLLEKQLDSKKDKLKAFSAESITIEKTQTLIQITAKETQEKLKFHIEDIVQLALDACLPDRYKFTVKFEIKRGRTEANLILLDKDGNNINPMTDTGGGVVDLVSFALRIATWSLGKTDNIIILDEPFRFISKDLIPKAAEIINQLSNKLNLQFIIVTHIQELAEMSDKIFEVKMKNNISHLQEIK